MTYFHINLDSRGKKKVLPPILIPVIISDLFLFVCFFGSLLVPFFPSGLSKTSLQGGTWEITLQLEAPGCHLRATGSGYVGQLNHLLGWASVFFCLYSDFF